jgi:hypothetical protein
LSFSGVEDTRLLYPDKTAPGPNLTGASLVAPPLTPLAAGYRLDPVSTNFGRVTNNTSSTMRFLLIQARVKF